jgi:hypothetical protein
MISFIALIVVSVIGGGVMAGRSIDKENKKIMQKWDQEREKERENVEQRTLTMSTDKKPVPSVPKVCDEIHSRWL